MTHQAWKFVARPVEDRLEDALRLEPVDLPELQDGEVRIRNRWLSMDAGTRMWMTDREDGYNPPLEIGSTMTGVVLGTVVASRNPEFPEGALVRGFGQWADHSTCEPVSSAMVILPEDVSPTEHLGVLGMNGWTALWGMRETAGVKAGDTVLVSAAAGATGILACQVARNLGAEVIGLAGTDEKCAWLARELGVRALNYRSADLESAFAAIPGGIDVYFDNVAGPLLDIVLPHMALHGRVALCGLLAQYHGDGRAPGPERFDQILMKRLRIEGFFIPDHFDVADEMNAQLREWLQAGRIFTPLDVTSGLENTLTAYRRLFSGANTGKVLVEL